MTAQSRMHGQSSTDARKGGERRSLARTNPAADGAAIERVVARVGNLSEFTDAQIRQIAAIALVALSVDDVDRQRRDETARDNRRRLRSWGRD
jgi:hypothetical protein